MIKRFIDVSFQVEGFHKWEDAPDEVSFLRQLHRHMFHFSVVTEVKHGDRDIEFILFKRDCEAFIKRQTTLNSFLEINTFSCEDLAEKLIDYIVGWYGERYIKVSVYEDNENGGIVEFNP